MKKSIYKISLESYGNLLRNPIFILPSFLFLLIVLFFDKLTTSSMLFLYIFILIQLSLLTILLSSIVFVSGEISNHRRYSFRELFYPRNFFRNLLIVLVSYLLFQSLNSILPKLAFWLSAFVPLTLIELEIVSLLFYLFVLLVLMSLFAFANFYITLKNKGTLGSIKSSFNLVKSNRCQIILFSIIFLLINRAAEFLLPLNFMSLTLSDIIKYLIIYPWLVLILAKFMLENEK